MIKMECLVMWNHVNTVFMDFKDIIFRQACKAWLGTILVGQWANAKCWKEAMEGSGQCQKENGVVYAQCELAYLNSSCVGSRDIFCHVLRKTILWK